MMLQVTKQHNDVIRTFVRHVEAIFDGYGPFEVTSTKALGGGHDWRKEQLQWFRMQAIELVELISGIIDDFEALKKRAESIDDNVSLCRDYI